MKEGLGTGTCLIVSNYIIFKFLIFECQFDVVSLPIVVEEFVGHLVFLFETELDSNTRDTGGLAHIDFGTLIKTGDIERDKDS